MQALEEERLGHQLVGEPRREQTADRERDPEQRRQPRRLGSREVDLLAVGVDPAAESELRARRRARRTSPTARAVPSVASVCSSRLTIGDTGGGTMQRPAGDENAAIAPTVAATPRPSCIRSGDDNAPSPKHRCRRFIARPTSLPRCQISIVLAPRSTTAAPRPSTPNTIVSSDECARRAAPCRAPDP